MIATGVESITFEITERAIPGGHVIGREFDIFGVPTGGAILLGDINQDGAVNLLDVQPFVDLLTGGGFQAEADLNSDGVVDLLDVQPFVSALTG